MTRAEYVEVLADLLNKDPVPRVREQRVREANRKLYAVVVSARHPVAKADLALAEAAQREQS